MPNEIKRKVKVCPKCERNSFEIYEDGDGELNFFCEDCNIIYSSIDKLKTKIMTYIYGVDLNMNAINKLLGIE